MKDNNKVLTKPQMVKVDGYIGDDGEERPLNIMKFPVMQHEYESIMGDNPSNGQDTEDSDFRPVEYISFYDSADFCNALSEQHGLKKCFTKHNNGDLSCDIRAKGFYIPPGKEWLHCATGGTQSKGFQLAGGNNPVEIGWFAMNSDGRTHRVGDLKPNELGIYDMSGNVWESVVS